MRWLIIFPLRFPLLRASFVPLLCRSVARRQSDGPLMCFLSARHCAAFVLLYLPSPCPNFFVTPNFKLLNKSSSNLRKLKRFGGWGGESVLLSGNFQPLRNTFCYPAPFPIRSGCQSFYGRWRWMMWLVCDKQDRDIMSAA